MERLRPFLALPPIPTLIDNRPAKPTGHGLAPGTNARVVPYHLAENALLHVRDLRPRLRLMRTILAVGGGMVVDQHTHAVGSRVLPISVSLGITMGGWADSPGLGHVEAGAGRWRRLGLGGREAACVPRW